MDFDDCAHNPITEYLRMRHQMDGWDLTDSKRDLDAPTEFQQPVARTPRDGGSPIHFKLAPLSLPPVLSLSSQFRESYIQKFLNIARKSPSKVQWAASQPDMLDLASTNLCVPSHDTKQAQLTPLPEAMRTAAQRSRRSQFYV
ncbi:predicted protein [Plenodomus lingam JN3]|uniref:Predicted protein n=1 Tax=Leptosphaeria maculans (strain JN3 / isolate v23.1.3 / race Av1-4-5-6-7-8) TaxID=985895 RepID=E4ZQ35_LEPMJ|nr:predicted protein [Plenodomus lingam JN3]CBX89945.1 predicted protein [Plenodomus lingam JN3]